LEELPDGGAHFRHPGGPEAKCPPAASDRRLGPFTGCCEGVRLYFDGERFTGAGSCAPDEAVITSDFPSFNDLVVDGMSVRYPAHRLDYLSPTFSESVFLMPNSSSAHTASVTWNILTSTLS
jgi:hypothetical protein